MSVPDMQLVFWASTALLAYTYVGYPLLIRLWAGITPQHHITGWAMPRLTLIVVA